MPPLEKNDLPMTSTTTSDDDDDDETAVTAMSRNQAIVIVAPYSTGCAIAFEFANRGYQIIALWPEHLPDEIKSHIPLSAAGLVYDAQVDEAATLRGTAKRCCEALEDVPIVACLAGGEAGVDLADALSEYLGLRTNGTDIPNRRDKKLQQELVREAGLRAVRQAGGNKLEYVEEFLKTEPYPLVVKPTESAGSDGVKLCESFEEARNHFHLLMQSQSVNGGMCPSVICQEFLVGKEWVIDHVSRDGVHKTMMTWVYDKRPANGSAFVYYGCVPVDAATEEAKMMIDYTRKVLDALGIKNGPTHAEVIMTKDGPCLVEMNCRANGGDAAWQPLAFALTSGYTQVDVAVDCYVNGERFDLIPDAPPSPFKAFGLEVNLVSYSEGVVQSAPGYDIVKRLPSFVSLETVIKAGYHVQPTVDLITTIGSVVLMNTDEDALKRDLDFVRHLELINGFFIYENKINLERRSSFLPSNNNSEAVEEFILERRSSFAPPKRNSETVNEIVLERQSSFVTSKKSSEPVDVSSFASQQVMTYM